MKRIAVIILNWNGQKLLEQFLPNVLQYSSSDDTEVIVADNGSSDNSVQFIEENFPNVPLILLDKNYGFAEGYNKAIREVEAKYIVLLNSDVETSENWLAPLINHLDTHPKTVAVQPKILWQRDKSKFEYAGAAGGFIDAFGYPFCRGRLLQHVEEDHGQYNNTIPVFWASGACLCIRRVQFIEAGGFDSDFFAHMEEIDLCWRLNARGKKIECVPSSIVYHLGGASLDMHSPQKLYLNFRNNLLMIYKNILPNRFFAVFCARCVLDILAMCHVLILGQFKNAKAIQRAYSDFFAMKSSFREKRRNNIEKTVNFDIVTNYKGSILWDYYFRGRRTFERIFGNNTTP